MDCQNNDSDVTNGVSKDSSINGPPETGEFSNEAGEFSNEEEGWYFQTDHINLKANPHYTILLKTLATLEAQRIQTLKDHDSLVKMKEQALIDPMKFMGKVLKGGDVGYPIPIKVEEIPDIDWTVYTREKKKHVRPRRKVPKKTGTRSSVVRGSVVSESTDLDKEPSTDPFQSSSDSLSDDSSSTDSDSEDSMEVMSSYYDGFESQLSTDPLQYFYDSFRSLIGASSSTDSDSEDSMEVVDSDSDGSESESECSNEPAPRVSVLADFADNYENGHPSKSPQRTPKRSYGMDVKMLTKKKPPTGPFPNDSYFSDSTDDDYCQLNQFPRRKMRNRHYYKKDDVPNPILVRGRAFDVSKPVTFNQLWTDDEQRRLEELLVEFPVEVVEQNRYKKIALALGNRTPQQVTSRIQKYFIKLWKAGLPIPGRSPGSGVLARTHKYQKYFRIRKLNRPIFKRTTFFPQMAPMMGDYNTEYQLTPRGEVIQHPSKHDGREDSEDELLKLLDDDEDIADLPQKMAKAKEARVVRLLEKVKEDIKKKSNVPPKHYGHKCAMCKEDPLEGTRWHCQTCIEPVVDFCSNCVIAQLESSKPHPLSHRLMPISTTYWTQSGYDQDYAPPAFAGGDVNKYNYLDPNFLPS